jgi:hypothetical protein
MKYFLVVLERLSFDCAVLDNLDRYAQNKLLYYVEPPLWHLILMTNMYLSCLVSSPMYAGQPRLSKSGLVAT